MLTDIVKRLYADPPSENLYHYTNLDGVMGIVEGGHLRMSEIHYLNDSEELKHLGRWLNTVIDPRLAMADFYEEAEDYRIMQEFRRWFSHRVENGPLVFVGSFTVLGNLLSQWRGYCRHGKGVSLGFFPYSISDAAGRISCSIGKCIYRQEQKHKLATEIVDAIVMWAKIEGPVEERSPYETYYPFFETVESDLLRIAALVKDTAFREENEWRVVSRGISDLLDPAIKYREGRTSLVPYMELPLVQPGSNRIEFARAYVGPTPTPNLSMNSLAAYLRRHSRCDEIFSSDIPYRAD